ncbi:cardiolipin synthase [Clostridium tyrobutyricum]|nr:cardiolipin synthase [Clostridium tyrobutyricum]MBV4417914.1 cardiolipin synthase [Clostridium tyrobutyricum]
MGERKIFTSLFKLLIFAFWIVFQFIAMTLIYNIFDIFFIYYFIFFEIISAIAVVHLNYKDENTSYKISWVVLILLIPVIGVMFYILSRIGIIRNFNRVNKINLNEGLLAKEDSNMLKSLRHENITRYNEVKLIKNISGYACYENTDINYFPCGELMYENLIEELKKAKKFIFLEFFIISKSSMLDGILEILKQKSHEGVEIRILVDYIGSFFVLPGDFKKILRENNIKFKMFNPVKLFLSIMLNYRDHRKIAIIDGRIAFTGGINIGDEYINKYKKYGYWKDMAISLEGDAVYSFTVIFLKMWQSISKKNENFEKYKFAHSIKNFPGITIPYASEPEKLDSTAEDIYLSIINSTKNYVYITTPYLVISYEMMLCLSLASKRGVDVRIITPSIPDKKIVQILTRSHYDKLLDAGVKIYEYTPGFIHGKVMLSDDECAVVGTINMDYRSLFLHFECAAYMYNVSVIKDIYKDFIETISVSQKIEKHIWERRNFLRKIMESILKLFAPLT